MRYKIEFGRTEPRINFLVRVNFAEGVVWRSYKTAAAYYDQSGAHLTTEIGIIEKVKLVWQPVKMENSGRIDFFGGAVRQQK